MLRKIHTQKILLFLVFNVDLKAESAKNATWYDYFNYNFCSQTFIFEKLSISIHTISLGNFGQFSQLFPYSASQKVGANNPCEQLYLVLDANMWKI